MPNEYADPSGNTEQFKAFARTPQETARRSRVPIIVLGVIAVVLIALVVFLLLD
jgi:hypothetical protein